MDSKSGMKQHQHPKSGIYLNIYKVWIGAKESTTKDKKNHHINTHPGIAYTPKQKASKIGSNTQFIHTKDSQHIQKLSTQTSHKIKADLNHHTQEF